MSRTANAMQNAEQRAQAVHPEAPEASRLSRDILKRLSWDDLRVFHTLADTGSLRAAARKHCIAVNTMRARMGGSSAWSAKPCSFVDGGA